jgi:hypothetical protein
MDNIIGFIYAALGAFLAIRYIRGDISTSAEGARLGLTEVNPRYRLPDGTANVRKIIVDKFWLAGLCLALTLILFSVT